MDFIKSITDFFSGKKTYIIAFTIVLLVILEKALAIDIPGVEIGDDWLNYVLSALGLSTLRAGIPTEATRA